MTHNIIFGKKGEDLASEFLRNKGYTILQRNFRAERGEIDLIATKENFLVFVEVKRRKNNFFGFPEEAVNAQKEEMILNTAQFFLDRNEWEGEIRFDIIAITGDKEIEHFIDAF